MLQKKLPTASGATTQVVFAATGADITSRADQAAIGQTLRQLAGPPQVVAVTSPFQTKAVSPDKHVALATVYYGTSAGDVKTSIVDKLDPAVTEARHAGIEVEFSGAVYPTSSAGASPEGSGLLVALIVLILTFSSFLADGMPILTALRHVIVSMMGMTALATIVSIAWSATSVATMLQASPAASTTPCSSCPGTGPASWTATTPRRQPAARPGPREARSCAPGSASLSPWPGCQ